MTRDMKNVPLITMAAAMHERNRVIARLRRAVISLAIFCLICIATIGYLFAQHQTCASVTMEVVGEVAGVAIPGGE